MYVWIFVTLGFVVFALAFFVAFLMERDGEDDPETQDDFHTSATRWGYLADRRKGGE